MLFCYVVLIPPNPLGIIMCRLFGVPPYSCPDTAKSSRYNPSRELRVRFRGCPDTAKSSRYNRLSSSAVTHNCCPDTAKSSRYNLHYFQWQEQFRCPDTAKSSRYNQHTHFETSFISCPDTAKSSRYNPDKVCRKSVYVVLIPPNPLGIISMEQVYHLKFSCPDTAKSSRYNRLVRRRGRWSCCPDTAKSSRYNLDDNRDAIFAQLSWYRQILSV